MVEVKEILKKFPPFMKAYSTIKATQLHLKNNRIQERFEKEASQKGIFYSNELVHSLFQKKVRARGIRLPLKKAGDLRIFYFGANEAQDRSGFLQALQRLGKVYLYYNSTGTYGPLYWHRKINHDVRKNNSDQFRKLLAEAEKEGPIDLVIGQMWANYFDVEALRECQKRGMVVINIAMDDRGVPELWDRYEGVLMGAIGLADGCDLVLNTSPECCLRFLVSGCACEFWPLASDPTLFFPSDKKDIDVCFIGSRYGIRSKYIEKIQAAGIPISVYGPGWKNGPVNASQACHIFSRSKVIFGIGTVGYTTDVYTMKLRDFDAPMAGAAYLTSRNPDLCSFYEEDKEILYYSTIDEALEKLKKLITYPEIAHAVGKAAYARARREHTWDFRLRTTLKKYHLIHE